jgi:hypothetical protein
MTPQEEYHDKMAERQSDEETVDTQMDNLMEYVFGDREVE